MKKFNDNRDLFFGKRYGMFIHWGIYAVNGHHEQEIYRTHMSKQEYSKYMNVFNPVEFNPDEWIDTAIECGMEYMVFTTKHIDGFCMWDTKFSDFSIMNTPYGKDAFGELAKACKRRNFPLGIYYSCADMNNKHYPNQGRSYEFLHPQPGDEPNMEKYIDYVKNQLTELCTNYGDICCVFWDANMVMHIDSSVNDLIRKLQPSVVINDRGYDQGDYGTPERDFNKDEVMQKGKFDRYTEACQSVGMESWGYRVKENRYSSKHLMQSIDRHFCKDANYLLNIGPTPSGKLYEKDIAVLKGINNWLTSVKESFFDVRVASGYITSEGVMMTVRENTVYLHILKELDGEAIIIDPLTAVPKSAVLLNTGAKLELYRGMGTNDWMLPMENLKIYCIPVEEIYGTVPVIKLTYDKLPTPIANFLEENV